MDLNKAIQIVNYLLGKYKYRLNYTKLIKLLYLSDREAYSRWDTAISGDTYCSMDHGPVLSGIYGLVKGRYRDNFNQLRWDEYFVTEGYELVSLREENVLVDELSERETDLLDEIDKEYHGWSWDQLQDLLHDKDKFPEWEDPSGTSIPLTVREILRSLGRSEEEIAEIIREEAIFEKDAQLLQSDCL